MSDVYTIDFETEAIQDGTGKAPKPVGVAIWEPGKQPRYMSWGHPTGNNCLEYEAKSEIARVWDRGVLFHHGKFDISVAMEHWRLQMPKVWDDTMYQIYLHNPLAKSVSLKPSAKTLLGIEPEEQDAVADYVMAKGWTKARSKAGAFISKCPASLIEPYAIGDVFRTRSLHDYLRPEMIERKWEDAYQRELQLAPILMDMEKRGVRIDRPKLWIDIQIYGVFFEQVTEYIQKRIGKRFNVDSPAELARALVDSPVVNKDLLAKTPTGRYSTARSSLEAAVQDGPLLAALRYRGALKTLLSTFMKPWYDMSCHDGHLHPSWNQVRGDEYGTRTGRLSCSAPNLMNVPTEFEDVDMPGYPPMIFMRRYILPDEGEVIISADYNGQEMRLLAHFAEGRAAEIYRTDPTADFHEIAKNIIRDEAGLSFPRKKIKITGFSLIYGAGIDNLAKQLGVDFATAKRLRDVYLRSIPGLREFIADVTSRPGVRTWGNRWIPVDRPEGTNWDFSYKLPNHLIQGSAADQTKQSIIEYNKLNPTGRFLLTVHDENDVSSPPEHVAENTEKLRYAMEKLPGFDVPFVVDVEIGYNWHNMKKYGGEGRVERDNRGIGRQQTDPNSNSKAGPLSEYV
jgi:DNA polymerase I